MNVRTICFHISRKQTTPPHPIRRLKSNQRNFIKVEILSLPSQHHNHHSLQDGLTATYCIRHSPVSIHSESRACRHLQGLSACNVIKRNKRYRTEHFYVEFRNITRSRNVELNENNSNLFQDMFIRPCSVP